MNDWARECSKRWLKTVYGDSMAHTAERAMVEGAIRETLAKAAEVADEQAAGLPPTPVEAMDRGQMWASMVIAAKIRELGATTISTESTKGGVG